MVTFIFIYKYIPYKMKHIELFKDGFDSTVQEKIQPENWPYVGYDMVTGEIVYTLVPKPVVGPADNEIWYTTVDGSLIQTTAPMDSEWVMMFGTPVVSNTYSNGNGVLLFENDLTKLGEFSITGDNLQSIIIPSKVNIIVKNSADSVFSQCENLASITVVNNNSTYDSRENCNAIIETASNTIIKGCKNTIIPDSVTSIGDYAFYNCSSLTSLTIPNSVTSIGDYAFFNCTSLTSVTIGNSVTSIGDNAFCDCDVLTYITFNSTIEEWNSITKGDYWNFGVSITYVQCYDGQVPL